jgi:ABC-type transport system involved in multi-copper enzyme maturation permease subunit
MSGRGAPELFQTPGVGDTTTTAAPAPLRTQGAAPLRLLKAELLKIRTTNTWWIFGILTLVFAGLTLLINLYQADSELTNAELLKDQPPPDFGKGVPAGQGGPTPEEIKRNEDSYYASIDVARILVRSAANVYTSGQFFGLLFMVILGALIVTNEFFHQTATTTFLTTPHRSHVILGKLAAAVVLAVGFWLLITVIDLSVGSAYFGFNGHSIPLADWPVLRSVLMNLLAFVIWAVLGVGLGVLIRSQLGATLTGAAAYLLSFPFAFTLFGLIRQFVIKEEWVWNWIVSVPGVASQVMISPERTQIATTLGPDWWVGALVLTGYGVVAGVVGTLITRKRDIS